MIFIAQQWFQQWICDNWKSQRPWYLWQAKSKVYLFIDLIRCKLKAPNKDFDPTLGFRSPAHKGFCRLLLWKIRRNELPFNRFGSCTLHQQGSNEIFRELTDKSNDTPCWMKQKSCRKKIVHDLPIIGTACIWRDGIKDLWTTLLFLMSEAITVKPHVLLYHFHIFLTVLCSTVSSV